MTQWARSTVGFVGASVALALSCSKDPPAKPPEASTLFVAEEVATLPASSGLTPHVAADGEPPEPPAPSSPPRPDHQQADLDPSNDNDVAPPEPIDDCEGRLERAGIRFRPAELPLKQKRGQLFTCGAEQVVTYLGGPAAIRYNAPPTMTCRMVLALAHFEQLAQEEAERHLGERIARFTQLGTYSCRKMARFDFVSEHSYANAIDIKAITLTSGARVSVERHFGPLDASPTTKTARFLRALAERAFDEELFSVVLTPYWDRLHRDHFHLDLARYRVDGTRR